MLLWGQKGAKIYALNGLEYDKGVPTNAVAYAGMSGGGCSTNEKPTELVGMFANGNSGSGHSAVDMKPGEMVQKDANYVSTFYKLDKRFTEQRLKAKTKVTKLSQLEQECEDSELSL